MKTINKLLVAITLISSCFCGICLRPSQHNMANMDTDQSYCGTVVKWPISPTTLNIHQQYDKGARAQYTEVYKRWVESGGSNNKDPTNDCLGVLRNILCAYNYPICSETEGDRVRVCNWYCDYLKDRCPKETDLYDLVCKTSAELDCAYTSILQLNIFILMIIFISLI